MRLLTLPNARFHRVAYAVAALDPAPPNCGPAASGGIGPVRGGVAVWTAVSVDRWFRAMSTGPPRSDAIVSSGTAPTRFLESTTSWPSSS